MRILYVALKFDYNRAEQGLSFEHYNFFDTLQNLGHEICILILELSICGLVASA